MSTTARSGSGEVKEKTNSFVISLRIISITRRRSSSRMEKFWSSLISGDDDAVEINRKIIAHVSFPLVECVLVWKHITSSLHVLLRWTRWIRNFSNYSYGPCRGSAHNGESFMMEKQKLIEFWTNVADGWAVVSGGSEGSTNFQVTFTRLMLGNATTVTKLSKASTASIMRYCARCVLSTFRPFVARSVSDLVRFTLRSKCHFFRLAFCVSSGHEFFHSVFISWGCKKTSTSGFKIFIFSLLKLFA